MRSPVLTANAGGINSYLELFPLWTFTFDQIKHLEAFAACATMSESMPLPIRSLRMVSYLPIGLYAAKGRGPSGIGRVDLVNRPSYLRVARDTWEADVQRLHNLCRRLPDLGTLRLSVIPNPVYCPFDNEPAILESLKMIQGVPRFIVELRRWCGWGRGRGRRGTTCPKASPRDIDGGNTTGAGDRDIELVDNGGVGQNKWCLV